MSPEWKALLEQRHAYMQARNAEIAMLNQWWDLPAYDKEER